MFTVTGILDGAPYRVGVHDQPPEDPSALGVVMGSPAVLDMLDLRSGETVAASPTSNGLTLDVTNPASVLAALHHHTEVTDVTGDVPDPYEGDDPHPPDAIY